MRRKNYPAAPKFVSGLRKCARCRLEIPPIWNSQTPPVNYYIAAPLCWSRPAEEQCLRSAGSFCLAVQEKPKTPLRKGLRPCFGVCGARVWTKISQNLSDRP